MAIPQTRRTYLASAGITVAAVIGGRVSAQPTRPADPKPDIHLGFELKNQVVGN